MKVHEEIVASAAAGCASTILGHPLDTVKVALQTGGSRGQSAAGVAAMMLRRDGPSAFSRGIGAPLANSILMNSVMFVVFAEARKRLPDDTVGSLCAGAFSGIAQAFLSTPMDWVKIQAQVHGGSSLSVLRTTLRSSPSVLYTGHAMNLCREGVFTAIYLGLYDRIRRAMLDAEPASGSSLPMVALTSATTGALAWLACFPFDSIKSVQQAWPKGTPAAKTSVAAAVATLEARGGLAAFYRGAASSTLRAVLVTCSRLVAYEYVASWMFGAALDRTGR